MSCTCCLALIDKEQQDKINPVELLNPSSPERRRSRRSYRSTGRRQDEEEARYTQDADADEEAEDKETSHRAYLDDSTYPGGENLHKSVVLDFYTPPRPKPRARKSCKFVRISHVVIIYINEFFIFFCAKVWNRVLIHQSGINLHVKKVGAYLIL